MMNGRGDYHKVDRWIIGKKILERGKNRDFSLRDFFDGCRSMELRFNDTVNICICGV
jgi:hypothetical protein